MKVGAVVGQLSCLDVYDHCLVDLGVDVEVAGSGRTRGLSVGWSAGLVWQEPQRLLVSAGVGLVVVRWLSGDW